MAKISIPVAEECDEPYLLHLEVNEQFKPIYPISVYARAAKMMNGITTNQAALEMAATHMELTKAKIQYTNQFEGTAFIPMPN